MANYKVIDADGHVRDPRASPRQLDQQLRLDLVAASSQSHAP